MHFSGNAGGTRGHFISEIVSVSAKRWHMFVGSLSDTPYCSAVGVTRDRTFAVNSVEEGETHDTEIDDDPGLIWNGLMLMSCGGQRPRD
jgi:hypothetical protein